MHADSTSNSGMLSPRPVITSPIHDAFFRSKQHDHQESEIWEDRTEVDDKSQARPVMTPSLTEIMDRVGVSVIASNPISLVKGHEAVSADPLYTYIA